MKPFLMEEDNNTGTDWMKVMEFPFPAGVFVCLCILYTGLQYKNNS